MYLSLCACVCVSPHAHSHTRPHTHTHTLSLSLFLSVIERGKRQTKRRTFISTLEPREHFTRKLLKSKHPRASTRGKKKSLWDNHNKTQQARRTDERQQASTPPPSYLLLLWVGVLVWMIQHAHLAVCSTNVFKASLWGTTRKRMEGACKTKHTTPHTTHTPHRASSLLALPRGKR